MEVGHAFRVGRANSLIFPVGVMRPILLPISSVNLATG